MLRMDVVVPEVPLLQTYVDGLDRVLGGGIPKGSTVLIAGTPGTMKTSLILWMMQENGRAHGVKSLYISLEQDMDSLKAGAARMGMGVLHESTVYVLDMGQLRRGLHRAESTKDWFTILTEIVKEAVASSGYQVLAIDSLEALYALSDLKTPRREMFHFLGSPRQGPIAEASVRPRPASREALWTGGSPRGSPEPRRDRSLRQTAGWESHSAGPGSSAGSEGPAEGRDCRFPWPPHR